MPHKLRRRLILGPHPFLSIVNYLCVITFPSSSLMLNILPPVELSVSEDPIVHVSILICQPGIVQPITCTVTGVKFQSTTIFHTVACMPKS